MPVVVTVREVIDMLLDDVLFAITIGGLFLSGTFIGAGFRESRRERDLQSRRSERVSTLPRNTPTKIHEAGT
jgi:hypothetical protein